MDIKLTFWIYIIEKETYKHSTPSKIEKKKKQMENQRKAYSKVYYMRSPFQYLIYFVVFLFMTLVRTKYFL